MDARHLTHGTNVVIVAAVGMTAAHVSMPTRPGTSLAVRLAFAATVVVVGALAGWRERRALEDERGTRVTRPVLWTIGGSASALLLSALAWQLVHG